jgi:arginine/ornithine N-succinyltransferase beta subunit
VDPVSLIVSGVAGVVDVIGGGPGARAEQARQNAIAESERTRQKLAEGQQWQNIALYGVIGVVALGGIFLVAKGFGV